MAKDLTGRRRFLQSSAALLGMGPLFTNADLAWTPETHENSNPSQNRSKMPLTGAWDYRPIAHTVLEADGSITDDVSDLPALGKMNVPCNWQVAGLPNFKGRVRFERDFDFPERLASADHVFLVFRGVDYFAEVRLNGIAVGRHEGYFQTFEFNVTPQIRRGRNHLVVTVDAPLERPDAVWPLHKRLIKGIFTHWDGKPGGLTKEFGQECTTGGVWNTVELEVRRLAWLGDVKIQPFLYNNNAGLTGIGSSRGKGRAEELEAKILITTEIHAAQAGAYMLTAEVEGTRVSSKFEMTLPNATAILELPIEHPRLWWTWDLGEPYLYTCQLTVAAQGDTLYERDVAFGVRSIELDEGTGEWRLNGVRFFIRGTSIVPEMWLSRYTPDRIAHDVQLLREANINGVRVCVHVNRQEFYDALDRAGIVAWQDFALQWVYTDADDFIQEAARQIRDMVRQLYNHPSIVAWVCQNESSGRNLEVLDPFLAHTAREEDSSRPVRPVSAFKEHTYPGALHGDYHEYLTIPAAPLVSEFGAQALPSLEETRAMFSDEWPPDPEKLAYHGFFYEPALLFGKVKTGVGWADFVDSSQRYQAKLLKFAIEQYRRAKYEKVGSIFQFQFVDAWQEASFTVLSYARKPKLGYRAVQQAYQPVLIGADLPDTLPGKLQNPAELLMPWGNVSRGWPLEGVLWVVNDVHREIDGATYEIRLRGDGKDIWLAGAPTKITIPADSVMDLGSITAVAPGATLDPGVYEYFLVLRQGEQMLSTNSYPVTVIEFVRGAQAENK